MVKVAGTARKAKLTASKVRRSGHLAARQLGGQNKTAEAMAHDVLVKKLVFVV